MHEELLYIARHGQIQHEMASYIEMLDKDSMRSNLNHFQKKYTGEKTHITYRCKCGEDFETKNRYKIGDNLFQQHGRQFSKGNLWTSFLESTIGNIPWIGDTIVFNQEQKVADQRNEKYTERLHKIKVEVFEKEMKDKIYLCEKCNNQVVCTECAPKRICSDCSEE